MESVGGGGGVGGWGCVQGRVGGDVRRGDTLYTHSGLLKGFDLTTLFLSPPPPPPPRQSDRPTDSLTDRFGTFLEGTSTWFELRTAGKKLAFMSFTVVGCQRFERDST